MHFSWLYFATVFWTGAAVLIVEISAIRLLAIQFGSSLSVLSGVLTVILLALSCGYYLGGKLADRRPERRILYTAITWGGVSLMILSSIALIVTHPAYNLSTTISPLVLALALFFVPAFILGIDSPFVTKLLTLNEPEHEGALVGLVFFWSTLGSIAGSLSTGFVLLPYLGVEATFLWTSASLMALGIIGLGADYFITKQAFGRRLLVSLFIGITLAISLFFSNQQLSKQITADRNIVHRSDGLYSHIMIYDNEIGGRPVRFLKREANNSSAVYLDSTDIVFEYTKFLPAQIALVEHPQNLLLIGGGAYTIPKLLLERYPDLQIDVVELEPSLYPLSQTYFQLPTSTKLTNYVNDGRRFLADTDTTYDLIYLDAFNSGHFIPPHLVTQEFFRLVETHLQPHGAVLANFIGSTKTKDEASLTGSFTKTFQTIFPDVTIYQTQMPGYNGRQNLLYQATAAPDTQLAFPASTTITTTLGERSFGAIRIDPADLINTSDTIFTDNLSTAELLVAQERW